MSDEKAKPNESTPVEPLTALMQAAVQFHELAMTLQAAGFTANEALTIVIGVIQAGITNGEQ